MPKAIKVLVTVFWKILKLWQTLYLTACSVNFLKSVMHETLASFQFLSEMSPSLVISTMPAWYSLLASVELELRLYVSKSQISTSEWRSGRSRTHPLHKQLKSRKRMHETVLCGWTITAGNLESWRKGNKSWDDDDASLKFLETEIEIWVNVTDIKCQTGWNFAGELFMAHTTVSLMNLHQYRLKLKPNTVQGTHNTCHCSPGQSSLSSSLGRHLHIHALTYFTHTHKYRHTQEHRHTHRYTCTQD